MPGEHAARQVSPDAFEKFRRENDKFGAGIHAIWGITADGKTEVQSIRFDSSKFTEDEAKAWLEKHGFKTTIEPAAEPEEKTMSTIETKAEAAQGSTMIEMINGAKSAIQVAVKQIDTAGSHIGDVRTYFTTGEKAAKPETDHGAKLDAASYAIGNAKGSLKAASDHCGGMKKQMNEKSFLEPRDSKQGNAMQACAEACEACEEACEACVADMTDATCKACAAACLACAKACDACDMPECDACAKVCRACAEACKAGPSDECMAACKACMAACTKCAAACEKTTKAGRVLSAANEEKLQAALDALKEIIEQVKPPIADSDYKPVVEPTAPDGNQPAKPVETTANKPTPVDLNKPDGSLSLQASAQAIVRRMLDPMDASDIRAVGKLAEAISVEMKSHERANRRASFRKALSLNR